MIDRPQLVWILGAATVLSLMISLLVYFGNPGRKVDRTLFFPQRVEVGSEVRYSMGTEQRRVRYRPSLEGRLEQLVEEVVLGPVDPSAFGVVPAGTLVQGVVVNRGTAYVSLSTSLIDPPTATVPLNPERRVETIAHTVFFNFPRIRTIHVLVDGQQPDWSRITGDPTTDFTRGITERRPLMR